MHRDKTELHSFDCDVVFATVQPLKF